MDRLTGLPTRALTRVGLDLIGPHPGWPKIGQNLRIRYGRPMRTPLPCVIGAGAGAGTSRSDWPHPLANLPIVLVF